MRYYSRNKNKKGHLLDLFVKTEMFEIRGVVPGGAGGAMALPDFDQLTPSQPRGADYAHQIILASPDFQTFRRPCNNSGLSDLRQGLPRHTYSYPLKI